MRHTFESGEILILDVILKSSLTGVRVTNVSNSAHIRTFRTPSVDAPANTRPSICDIQGVRK